MEKTSINLRYGIWEEDELALQLKRQERDQ